MSPGMFKQIPKFWHLIATRLYVSFGTAIALIIVSSLLALYALDYIDRIQHDISKKNVPEMQLAFNLAQHAATLVSAVPRIMVVTTPEQLEAVTGNVEAQEDRFHSRLALMLKNKEDNATLLEVRSSGSAVIGQIRQAERLVGERIRLRRRGLALIDEVQASRDALAPRLGRTDDDRRLGPLREAVAVAAQLLAAAFAAADADRLGTLRKRFGDAEDFAARSLDALRGTPRHDRLSRGVLALLSIGTRPDGGFALRGRELAIDGELEALLRENRALGDRLTRLIKSAGVDRSAAMIVTMGEATNITTTSTALLLVINFLSIGGAILIGTLFVRRRLISRLARLSYHMKEIAQTRLEEPVDTSGNDEISELARTVEVFRDNALEVQRLNLVEILANDLKENNRKLEEANEQLKRMQDQLVMREKLAALGQLTAGVAHEIKNPMNFIMNFAQVSQDLLEELLEEMDKAGSGREPDGPYDPELVQEVVRDLRSNLQRIREHGMRANRIVVDMLKMGRGTEEWRPTDLGALLGQSAGLAFHSARASDPDFQLEIEEDYAGDIGEVRVQPQEIGRVFLNLITNACYAMNEKRKAGGEGAGPEPYRPVLALGMRRASDAVEVRVRDNGGGIPESALKHIFNPFYTTKPPDEGTGLGLSLSSDIVRKHGGEIRADTVEGEYTEMTVVLPLRPEAGGGDGGGEAPA